MKLEKNMYVRTKEGIRKIINIYKNNYELNRCLHYLYPEGHDLYGEDIDDIIIKASHNIIDLIEVGDYVNGYLVLFAGATTWDNDGNVLDKQVHINHNGYDLWLREEYIKSIVTKEQFESVSYKVGE